jgi:RNA polymerase primary sigma factor
MSIDDTETATDLVVAVMNEKDFPGFDETYSSLPQEVFRPEETLSYLTVSDINLVQTMQRNVGLNTEDNTGWGDIEKISSESADSVFWSYMKDIGNIPLLTSDEEYEMARDIEEAEQRAKNVLFKLPQAVSELWNIGRQLKEGKRDIADVVNNIDETGCARKDEARHRRKTVSAIIALKALHEKKEAIEKKLTVSDKAGKKQLFKDLKKTEDKIEETLFCLRLNGKTLKGIIRNVEHRTKDLNDSEAYVARQKLVELSNIEKELKRVRDRLVQANLRLVIAIARRYLNRGLPFLDLVQEGNMGLMKAAEKYDFQKGYRFSTYSTWWIKQAVTRAIADTGRTIRVPVHVLEARNKIIKASTTLFQELGKEPTLDEIAVKTGLPVEKIGKIVQAFCSAISIETPVGDDDGKLSDLITDPTASSPFNELIDSFLREEGDRALSTLTAKEEKVLRMRLGIGEPTDYTLEEVGEAFGLTRERIRQIEANALRKLQHPTRQRRLKNFHE